MKAMAKEQAERFPTVLAFSRELVCAGAGARDTRAAVAPDVPSPERPPVDAGATTKTLRGAAKASILVHVRGRPHARWPFGQGLEQVD